MEEEVRKLKQEVAELRRTVNKDDFSQVKVFTQVVVLKEMQALPTGVTVTGALCVVAGKLRVYNGLNWVVVGNQT